MKHFTQNIFFISDTHFAHKNVIIYDKRPFSNIEEMNRVLIENWNNTVGENDIVYFLGDFCFGGVNITKEIANSLNGVIYFIMGNHDRYKTISKIGRFENIYEYGTEIYIKDETILQTDRNRGFQMIVLSHYPMIVWNKCHRDTWMLHGHCHGSLFERQKELYQRKITDVGCNVIDYKPINYKEIRDIMNKKVIKSVDHH